MPNIPAERGRFIPALEMLFEDNSQKTPDQLAEVAYALSPGGAHVGGELTNLLLETAWFHAPDPLLLGALIYSNWTGGKVGFQFQQDPCTTDPDEYAEKAEKISDALSDAGPPTRFLMGDDLAFYNALPNVITIYRGFAGVSEDIGALGLCWTTNKQAARWFAWRASEYKKSDPLLLMARVGKRSVLMAHSMEDEVVAWPRSFRRVSFGNDPIQWKPEKT